MKNITTVILLALVVLGAVVPGCDRVPRYDGRLTALDSLMRGNPDSVVAVLEALTADSFASEGDHAYRDLLLTQARYKAYITATSDSAINRALAYFSAHPSDREKLTRAYIYKGAVMQELGHPDSAMLYYKHAEATAAPDDYFNLGYVKMRIGALYRDYYTLDGKHIEKYEEALSLFSKANDIEYKHTCLNNLGCLYRNSNPAKAKQLLQNAAAISKCKKDTVNFMEDLHALAVLFYYDEKYDSALTLIQEAIHIDISKVSFSFCTTAANVYARNGKVDSAQIFLDYASKIDYQNSEKNEMYLLESKAEIKLAQGDTINYLRLSQLESRISDSLITNTAKPTIIKAENSFDKVSMETTNRRLSKAMKATLTAICIAIILAFGIILYKHKSNQYRHIIEELRIESDAQLISLDELQKRFDSLQIKENNIRQFITTQLDMLRGITANCYHAPNNKLSMDIKNTIAFQDENKQLWPLIYDYIDAEYNNIISDTHKKHPDLNDKELLLLALSCMDFSYIQMAIILGYPNPTSVGTLKTRLAEKIGCPINDYISSFTHQ